MINQIKRILLDFVSFPTVLADSNLDMIVCLRNCLEGSRAQVDVLADETGRKANFFALSN